MKTLFRILANVFAPASILLAGVATPVEASIIRLVANTVLNADTLSLHLANTGDEAAFNVQVQVLYQGEERTSPALNAIPAGGQAVFPFHFVPPDGVGLHPIRMVVDYTDANLYPFSIPLVHVLRVGAVGRPDVFAGFTPIRMAGTTTAPLILKNQGERPRTVHVSFHGPREITIGTSERSVTMEPRSEYRIPVQLDNFSATLRSRYPLFALMSYEEDGVIYTSYARGDVETVAASRFANMSFWRGLIALAFILGAVLVVQRVRHVRAAGARLAPTGQGVSS